MAVEVVGLCYWCYAVQTENTLDASDHTLPVGTTPPCRCLKGLQHWP